jgi:hypothetical protein
MAASDQVPSRLLKKGSARFRHSGENGNPDVFEIPGFRVALTIPVVSFGSKTVAHFPIVQRFDSQRFERFER